MECGGGPARRSKTRDERHERGWRSTADGRPVSDHTRGHERAVLPLPERSGPLTDIRIIDLTAALAGPFCTMLLADMGADVIKVEPPKGDFTRYGGPFTKGDTEHHYGGYFASVNRSKRSIVLDLQRKPTATRCRELVRDADVIVENFRAGVLDRLGLGYEALAELNPRLVYGAIRGFGDPRTGESPYADWPAFDVVAQAMSGLVATTGDRRHVRHARRSERRRHLPGHAAGARHRVGGARGPRVRARSVRRRGDVRRARRACARRRCTAGATGAATTNRTATSIRSICRIGVFATADGAVAMAAPTNHWPILCEIMGRPDLIDDERTRDNRARTRTGRWCSRSSRAGSAQRTTAEVLDALGGRVPVGPVNNNEMLFDDPHLQAREMLVALPDAGQ